MDSIYKINSNDCTEVYQTWKSARDSLSLSIQTYVEACDALKSVSIEALTQSTAAWGSSLPDALSTIDSELFELVNEEERLRKARLSLLASRNSSRNFSKINSLPTEVLSSIFLAAEPRRKDCTLGSHSRYPTAIASVCQIWRQIALDLPSMWSNLRYYIDGPQELNSHRCAELWGERARDLPRYVEMYQFDSGINLDAANDAIYYSLGS